jgi:3-deoxy-manno-octulosonate cytidylyltransferase (CMP-KDO synthetase)
VPRKILGIIPARYASSRFPGKALARLHKLSVIQHVYDRAVQAQTLTSVIIATDDRRIFDEAREFGAMAQMTSQDHCSGTDRAAEVALLHDDVDLVVNIQGDEPLIDPAAIDAAVRSIADDAAIPMATLKKRIEDAEDFTDPNVVKVVTDLSGNALYFSRSPIPLVRDGGGFAFFKHIGLYVYRRDFLVRYRFLPVGPLERAEKLEQLRALENGFPIKVTETSYDSIGVDTPADLEKITARLPYGLPADAKTVARTTN